MGSNQYIPTSLKDAGSHLRTGLEKPPSKIPRDEFLRVWNSIAYLYPGLHPDMHDDEDGGWPCALKPFAAEAWRRNEAGELTADEIYPSDAQWCGLYDRMSVHTSEETARREDLAGMSGISF